MAGMITEKMEQQLADTRASLRQDKDIPMCINIDDGRLVPNNKATRELVNYKPYAGPLNATKEQRMAFIKQSVGRRVNVVASSALIEIETFDVSKATRDELVSFAFDNYGTVLDPEVHLSTLRKQVKDIADRMDAAVSTLT